MLDARLEDGSRVAAMFPPCAVDGPTLTIRKFTRRYTLDDLVDVGTLTPALATQLYARRRGAAEHSDLRRHRHGQDDAAECPGGDAFRIGDRIVVIEETAEIHLDKPNLRPVRGATRAGAARPGGAAARRDHRRPACARPFAIVRIASSSARCAARKRSTCCRRSTPAISEA